MKKIGVLGLMAALAVTGAVAFLPKGVMAAEDSDQTISQGVYIGDVDVSGMTQEEAKKAVEDGMSEAKAANITLKVDDQETVVSAKDLGLSWANEEVVQEAAELGKSGNIIKRYKDKKDLENESRKYDIDYSVDRSSIQKVLEEKEDVFNREPTDAQLSTENGAFEVVQGENGIELNVEKSVKKILKYLKLTGTAKILRSSWRPISKSRSVQRRSGEHHRCTRNSHYILRIDHRQKQKCRDRCREVKRTYPDAGRRVLRNGCSRSVY